MISCPALVAALLMTLGRAGFAEVAGGEGGASPVYLAIIWHQHQPSYVDPLTDGLRAPWVRTHATKDYFDMAEMIGRYPSIHVAVNLTSSLLLQLQEYYVDRIGPYVIEPGIGGHAQLDSARFLSAWRGRSDPWIDLALTSVSEWGDEGRARIVGDGWSARSISPVLAARWPELERLLERDPATLDAGEMRSLLAHFYVVNFDPDFLRGPVALPGGGTVDLRDIVEEPAPNRFRFRVPPTLALTSRLVAEAWRVMAAVVPQHRALRYDPERERGQIELVTTPYYHPILPLLVDSDLAAQAQSADRLPRRFAYPADAALQVEMGAAYFERLFGARPAGFWPAEGSVAEAVVGPFADAGLRWIATDEEVLRRSLPGVECAARPYRVDAGELPGTARDEASLAVFFRNTDLSDRIGFDYQSGEADGEASAEDFVAGVLAAAEKARRSGGVDAGEDLLITVILDGENAWEWYENDPDGKAFLGALYRRLEEADRGGVVKTVTPIEYLLGNASRGIAPHPVSTLPEIEPLWAGSWIAASFATWIGEGEENAAWEALGEVRAALEASGIAPPEPGVAPPEVGSSERAGWEAWRAMLAAEGSDWFWWYGSDQEIAGGDDPFDESFRALLAAVGRWGKEAGASIEVAEYASFLEAGSEMGPLVGGTMSRAHAPVLFAVDCRAIEVGGGIYLVGGHPALGSWVPNRIAMRDDGEGADHEAGDGVWSLRVELPVGATVEYKFTNSGRPGSWVGEEFAMENRSLVVETGGMSVRTVFGRKGTDSG